MRALIILAVLAQAQGPGIAIVSGVTDADLADTPVMSNINMEEGRPTNQLSLTLAVTPGTSLIVNVACYESVAGTTWSRVSLCDNATPSTCKPELRTYTLADYAGSVKAISSRWPITKKWARCSVDDPADGDGTVTITGVRSYR